MSQKGFQYDIRTLQSVHQGIGEILALLNRIVTCGVVLGLAFSITAYGFLNLGREPEKLLNLQAFLFNYTELAHAGEKLGPPSQTGGAGQKTQDPVWDGFMAGAGIGMTVGRSIPFIGGIIGFVTGGMIGHQVDQRV